MAKITDASRKKESALLSALQKKHGYTLLDVKPRERFLTVFNLHTKQVDSVRVVRLAVPGDSSLGRAMSASDKAKLSKKGKR